MPSQHGTLETMPSDTEVDDLVQDAVHGGSDQDLVDLPEGELPRPGAAPALSSQIEGIAHRGEGPLKGHAVTSDVEITEDQVRFGTLHPFKLIREGVAASKPSQEAAWPWKQR